MSDDLVRITELKAEVERLKGLLGRYADHVGLIEGSDFLRYVYDGDLITPDEAQEISGYCPSKKKRRRAQKPDA